MRLLLFGPTALALSLALAGICLNVNVLAHQWDPLKRVREKAEQLKKKIECAVNDPACIEKAKKQGAEAKTNPPAPTAGGPSQTTAAGAASAAASASPLNATFTSTPLAPSTEGHSPLQTVVSNDGARAAGVAMRGSRYVVVVDGQDGPLFDQISPSSNIGAQMPQGAAAFAPGGKRVAYIGVKAGTKIAVIDGKEGPPFTDIIANVNQGDPDFGRVFHFSEDDSRVAYIGWIMAAGTGFGRLFQVVLDGAPGSRYVGVQEMVFAGKRHAYVAQRTDRKYVLVVDGIEQTSTFDGIQSLRGNKDGHIAFLGSRGNSYSVVVDGVEGKVHEHPQESVAQFVLAPSGKRAAYVVRSSAPAGSAEHLYVDGKIVRSAAGFSHITFSPDGTRLAGWVHEPARGGGPAGKVFVDDWTSSEYARLASSSTSSRTFAPLTFSPDSKRFACIVSNGPTFVIVDGKESPGYAGVQDFRFSPDGRHYAFQAGVLNPGGGFGHWLVVVDGKEGPKMIEVKRDSLTFSPDGSRVAYAGMTGFSDAIAVIDGQEHKIPVTSFKPRVAKMILNWKAHLEDYFVFSRDGKRLAYVIGVPPSGQGPGYATVDGQPQTPGVLFALPAFSPDGKRFAHAVWFNQKWLLSIDGKAAPIDGELYEAPRSLAFQDDGSVRFLVTKDNTLHRVVVTPKGGTN